MRLLHDPRFLSETIAAIYDCAVDPARWQVVIPQLAGLIGARRAALGVATISGAMPVVAALHGYDGVDNMATYAPLNPLLPLALVAVPDKALVASRAIGLPALRATRFYREYLRPLGDLDAVGFVITREADALGHWALITQDDRPPVSDEEIAGLELIAPHVRRAAEISRVLGVQQIESATYRAVLDRLDSAVLILDGRRRLSHVNPRGEAALSEGRVLRLRDGRLVGATDEAEATLRRAIDSALAGDAGAEATVKGTDGAESLLFAVTLEAEGDPRLGQGGRSVLLILRSPREHTRNPVGIAARVFGLTPAQVQVLTFLAQGHAPDVIGDILGISIRTVRTHLADLFVRTGTSRQAELVARTLSFASPLRQDGREPPG